jgi:hypothetical protein
MSHPKEQNMPIHAVVGHLVVILAPITALLALVYAGRHRARPALRWPLVAGSVLTAALVVWAGEVGGTLLDRVKEHGTVAETAAATAHAKDSDTLALTVFVLLAIVLIAVLRLARPGRIGTAPRIAAVLLALGAVAVLVTTWTTLSSALAAVWEHHPSWMG